MGPSEGGQLTQVMDEIYLDLRFDMEGVYGFFHLKRKKTPALSEARNTFRFISSRNTIALAKKST
jgi:hypothetical protein